MVARTGFPFNGTVLTANVGGANPRPDLVPGQPIWIANPQAGGGKSLNPNAFTMPPGGEQGTEGRNDIRGFGLTEVDASVGRNFAITDRLNLQFRADAFNLFNHPNFANPLPMSDSGEYVSSSSMLNHGLGGLNPLFQEGGPRSLQLSLKLTFKLGSSACVCSPRAKRILSCVLQCRSFVQIAALLLLCSRIERGGAKPAVCEPESYGIRHNPNDGVG